MTAVVAAFILLAIVGAAPTLALTHSLAYTFALGPIAGAIQLWVGAQLGLLTGLGWMPATLLVGAVTSIVAAAMLIRRSPNMLEQHPWSTTGWDTGLASLGASILPWTMIRRAPVDWDARSIWFFQAEWLAEGGSRATDALTNPAFSSFAHPDYPKLGPASVAAVWNTFDSRSVESAQATTSVLVVAAVVGLGVTIGVGLPNGVGRGRHARRNLLAVTGLFTLALHGVAGTWMFNGYMDGLWAALLVGGFAATVGCANDRTFAAGIVMLTAAVCTKNEALIPVLVVGVVIAATHRREPRRVVAGFTPMLFAGAWLLIRRVLDVPSTYGSGELREISSGASTERLSEILVAIGGDVGLPVLAFASVVLLGGRNVQRRRSDLGLGTVGITVVTIAASLAALVAALMIVDPDRYRPIAERATIAAIYLLLFDMFLALVAAADLAGGTAYGNDDASAEPFQAPDVVL